MKKKKPGKEVLAVAATALVLLSAAGVFYALKGLGFETGGPLAEIAGVSGKTTEGGAGPDKPIDASTNLFLDTRREPAGGRESADPLSNRQIYFAGVGDELLSYDAEILLENLAENGDFMMAYIVTDMDSGEVVFETGLITSGECVAWAPGHDLGAGEHHLNFHIAPYYPQGEEYLPLTSANNEVTFTVTE